MIMSRNLFICWLLVASFNLSAYIPGQRAAIQDLTRAISEGKISEAEARKKAVSFKIKDKDLTDSIVNNLIITADSKGIQDIANPAMVNTMTSSTSKSVVTGTVSGPSGTMPVYGYAKEEPAPVQGKYKEEIERLIDMLDGYIRDLEKQPSTLNLNWLDIYENALVKRMQALKKNIAADTNYRLNKTEQTLMTQADTKYDKASKLLKQRRDAILAEQKPQPQPAAEKPAPAQVTEVSQENKELAKQKAWVPLKKEANDLIKSFENLAQKTITTPEFTKADQAYAAWTRNRSEFTSRYYVGPVTEDEPKVDTVATTTSLQAAWKKLEKAYTDQTTKPTKPTTTAAPQPSVTTTTQPAAIPTDVQALINDYKNRKFSPEDLWKIMDNTKEGNLDITSLQQDRDAFNQKSADQIKKDMERAATGLAEWTDKRIAFAYAQLMSTKGFISKYSKSGLSEVDADDALQKLLSKDTNTTKYSKSGGERLMSTPGEKTYFVKILDKNNDTLLNPAKIQILSGATGFRGQQTTQPASVPKTETAIEKDLTKQMQKQNEFTAFLKELNKKSEITYNEWQNVGKYDANTRESYAQIVAPLYGKTLLPAEKTLFDNTVAMYKTMVDLRDQVNKKYNAPKPTTTPPSVTTTQPTEMQDKNKEFVRKYSTKDYDKKQASDYVKKIDNTWVSQDTSKDTTTKIAALIEVIVDSAIQAYKTGADSFREKIDKMLVAYYKAQAYYKDLEVKSKDKDQSDAAKANSKINALIRYEVGENNYPLAHYIHKFETTQPQPAGAKVPAQLQQLADNINKSIYDERSTLEAAFGTPAGFGDLKNTPITLYYKHIFGLDFNKSTDTEIVLSGFHHDHKKKVEKSNDIQFSDIKLNNKTGCYSAELKYNNKPLGDRKNFFPSDWTRDKVVKKIREAYDNKNVIEKNIGGPLNDTFAIHGKTTEGIDILMRVNNSGLIFTAHPENL